MTRTKKDQVCGYRGKASFENPIRLSIANRPTLVPTELARAAEPSLLATLDIVMQALARARAQAAQIPEVEEVEVSPTLAAMNVVGTTTERHRRDFKADDSTGGVRVDMSFPKRLRADLPTFDLPTFIVPAAPAYACWRSMRPIASRAIVLRPRRQF